MAGGRIRRGSNWQGVELFKGGVEFFEGSLCAIIDLLIGAKFITLYFIWLVGGRFSQKKSQI